MPAYAVIGAQWGDEGKGKIVDLLSQEAQIVARYQGGANAGHTVYQNDKKSALVKFKNYNLTRTQEPRVQQISLT